MAARVPHLVRKRVVAKWERLVGRAIEREEERTLHDSHGNAASDVFVPQILHQQNKNIDSVLHTARNVEENYPQVARICTWYPFSRVFTFFARWLNSLWNIHMLSFLVYWKEHYVARIMFRGMYFSWKWLLSWILWTRTCIRKNGFIICNLGDLWFSMYGALGQVYHSFSLNSIGTISVFLLRNFTWVLMKSWFYLSSRIALLDCYGRMLEMVIVCSLCTSSFSGVFLEF